MFRFGASYGCIIGVLCALQIRVHLVSGGIWKKHFRLDSDKEKSRALALRLFPASSEHFSRKRDHHRAEASLLAVFGASLDLGGRSAP
jgi:crossover junction endodeoxyribonuclease RuvC